MGEGSNPICKNPWADSARKRGPLGTKRDAADPNTPAWFLGDTRGTIGRHDRADPSTKIDRCRQRFSFDAKRLSARRRVEADIKEAIKLRNAYADKSLLNEAMQKDWSATEYQKRIVKKVFGKRTGSMVPMYVDPQTGSCQIRKNWKITDYHRHGFPDVCYQADLEHEKVHQASCQAKRDPSVYAAEMSFPAELSAEEIKAYNKKIAVLRQWLQKNDVDALRKWVRNWCP
jgi:hypothetical protein